MLVSECDEDAVSGLRTVELPAHVVALVRNARNCLGEAAHDLTINLRHGEIAHQFQKDIPLVTAAALLVGLPSAFFVLQILGHDH